MAAVDLDAALSADSSWVADAVADRGLSSAPSADSSWATSPLWVGRGLTAAPSAGSSMLAPLGVNWAITASPVANSSPSFGAPPIHRALQDSITSNSFITATLRAAVPDTVVMTSDSHTTATLRVVKELGLLIHASSMFSVGWLDVARKKPQRIPPPPVPSLRVVPQPPSIPKLSVTFSTRRKLPSED